MYILEKLKDNCIWQGLYVQKYYIDIRQLKFIPSFNTALEGTMIYWW